MKDDTQPEALRIADEFRECLERDAIPSIIDVEKAVAELCRQHARIAELEAQLEAIGAGGVNGPLIGQPQAMPDLSQLTERGAKAWAGVDAQGLREGFTAADMATASAQGFRDGVASISANAESELVYQARYRKGFWQHSSRECYEYLQNPENTCADDWETRILYTHPSTPEGMAVTDAMIDAGKKMLHNSNGRGAREKVERIFNAMIAAAPPTTPAGSGKGE